jgi:hypothetical protein
MGPFDVRRLGARDWWPEELSVDGDTIAATETDRRRRLRYSIYEPGEPPVRFSAPTADSSLLDVAGSLIAYTVPLGDAGSRERVVVFDWRRRQVVHHVDLPASVESIDLAPDGRILAGVDSIRDVGLYIADPMSPPRRLLAGKWLDEASARFAGRLVVVKAGGQGEPWDHVAVVDPVTGAWRRLGPNSAEIDDIDAQGDRVAWEANGCVFGATVRDPGIRQIPAGPCPRSEVYLGGGEDLHRHARLVRVPVRCVTSDAARCRVRLRLADEDRNRTLASGRFAVRRGSARKVLLQLTRSSLRRLNGLGGDQRSAAVRLQAKAVDKRGRATSTDRGVFIRRPRRPR